MLGTEPNIAALMGKFLLLGIVIAHRWNSQYKCWHDPIESYAAYAMRHALSTSNHHSDRLRELDHDGSVQGLPELEQMFHWAYIREDLLGTLGFTMVFWAIKYMDSKAFLQILPTNLGDPAKFLQRVGRIWESPALSSVNHGLIHCPKELAGEWRHPLKIIQSVYLHSVEMSNLSLPRMPVMSNT